MRGAKITLFVILAALVAVGMGTSAYAFHSGGVAECEGCHSMHSPASDENLLTGSDASSTCLSCHEKAGDTGPSSYHVSTAEVDMAGDTAPLHRTPGGDFGWLKKTWSAATDPPQRHGHNIIAEDKNYSADDNNAFAPGSGGTFASSNLGCQSCHDQHGQARRTSDTGGYQRGGTLGTSVAPIIASGSYTSSPIPTATAAVGIYRLLRANGDSSQGPTFVGAPIAIAPSTYNQTEASNQVRVAYGHAATNTWGRWCATCHGEMHEDAGYVHPVDRTLSSIASIYNAYKTSGDLTGLIDTSFSSLVPFAENTGDYALLKTHASNTGTYLTGPSGSDRVMCLSCHRAHASGMAEALRFDIQYEFMTYDSNYIGMDNPSMTSGRKPIQTRNRPMAVWQAAYYDRPAGQFATYQRVLCNKCHAKD